MTESASRHLLTFAAAVAVTTGCAGTPALQPPPAPTTCNRPAAEAIVHVPVPGNPFAPVPTRDGCWIFASLSAGGGGQSGVAVLERSDGTISLTRVVSIAGTPAGMVLSHDGQLLIVAAGDRLAFLDVSRLISGQGDPVLGYMSDPSAIGRIYVNVTSDDRFLFVSEERSQAISVIDLAKARASGFRAASTIGQIPAGNAPVGLTLSPDERYLYATSQAAPKSFGWPADCRPEAAGPGGQTLPNHAHGAVLVVDVARAKTDPAHSVIAAIAAGCNPVRIVMSPSGDRVYVTARSDNELLVFDTNLLLTDSAHAMIGRVPVGTAPVGVVVMDGGNKVAVTNSNRFAGSGADQQFLTVIDAARVSTGKSAVLGKIPAGGFPRELRLTADGQTLLVTNFSSRTVEIVDLSRLSLRHFTRSPNDVTGSTSTGTAPALLNACCNVAGIVP